MYFGYLYIKYSITNHISETKTNVIFLNKAILIFAKTKQLLVTFFTLQNTLLVNEKVIHGIEHHLLRKNMLPV